MEILKLVLTCFDLKTYSFTFSFVEKFLFSVNLVRKTCAWFQKTLLKVDRFQTMLRFENMA